MASQKNEAGPVAQLQNTSELLLQKIPVARDQETVAIFRLLARLKKADEFRLAQAFTSCG